MYENARRRIVLRNELNSVDEMSNFVVILVIEIFLCHFNIKFINKGLL